MGKFLITDAISLLQYYWLFLFYLVCNTSISHFQIYWSKIIFIILENVLKCLFTSHFSFFLHQSLQNFVFFQQPKFGFVDPLIVSLFLPHCSPSYILLCTFAEIILVFPLNLAN